MSMASVLPVIVPGGEFYCSNTLYVHCTRITNVYIDESVLQLKHLTRTSLGGIFTWCVYNIQERQTHQLAECLKYTL